MYQAPCHLTEYELPCEPCHFMTSTRSQRFLTGASVVAVNIPSDQLPEMDWHAKDSLKILQTCTFYPCLGCYACHQDVGRCHTHRRNLRSKSHIGKNFEFCFHEMMKLSHRSSFHIWAVILPSHFSRQILP